MNDKVAHRHTFLLILANEKACLFSKLHIHAALLVKWFKDKM